MITLTLHVIATEGEGQDQSHNEPFIFEIRGIPGNPEPRVKRTRIGDPWYLSGGDVPTRLLDQGFATAEDARAELEKQLNRLKSVLRECPTCHRTIRIRSRVTPDQPGTDALVGVRCPDVECVGMIRVTLPGIYEDSDFIGAK